MIYGSFAEVYDELMWDLDYKKLANFIEEEIEGKTILEMACGTGTIIDLLEDKYEMEGFDISEDMLAIARNKVKAPLYKLDIKNFNMMKTYDGILCLSDSLNYILQTEDLENIFKNVYKHLNNEGKFIFDLNTHEKFLSMEKIYVDESENAFYVWEDYYDEDKRLNTYYVNFFIRDKDKYKRVTEEHIEKAHDLKKIEAYLKRAGFDIKKYNDYNREGDVKGSHRMTFVCKKWEK